MNYNQARNFIYQNARPLDFARWQYLFENGSCDNVLNALKSYQNEDGGFGHALEADCWNPNSSPLQTWVATKIIREIQLSDSKHPIIQGILCYLETCHDFNGHCYLNTIPTNNDFAHAPWWNYQQETINYNPTASLIGFILRYANQESKLYSLALNLVQEAYTYFRKNCPLDSMHTASNFVDLYEDLVDCHVEIVDLVEFKNLLIQQINYLLTNDISLWDKEYVCKPSLFIHSKKSPFYEMNQEICEYECEFISKTQKSDGTWAITWNWGCYPEQWTISKNW
ncbi:MAG: hypothetical protein ACI4U3_00010, partial [Traorella sp.]